MSNRSKRKLYAFAAASLLAMTAACGGEGEAAPEGKATLAVASNASEPPNGPEQAGQTPKPTSEQASPSSQQPEQAITVQGTFTLSRNDLLPVTGRNEYLNVVLVRGTYHEDWNPGPFMGGNWSGDFELLWTDEQGTRLAALDLADLHAEPLVFGSFFQLSFGDYNGDGAPDFTLGQYGTSNEDVYELYTLLPDHRIERLPVDEGNELFISGGGNRYSVPLEMEDSRSFRTLHYDNSTGKYVKQLFKWDGTRFERSPVSDKIESGDES